MPFSLSAQPELEIQQNLGFPRWPLAAFLLLGALVRAVQTPREALRELTPHSQGSKGLLSLISASHPKGSIGQATVPELPGLPCFI